MLPTEFGMDCQVPNCGWHESWSTDEASKLAGVWHVYEAHPDLWTPLLGDRLPLAAPLRPEDLGVRFEQWESQL